MPKPLKLDPTAVGAAAAAVYVAVAMLYHAFIAHDGVFSLDEMVAAIGAVYGLFVRSQVTPLARPRDRRLRPLVIQGHVER